MDFVPWVKYPALTKERLGTVAAILRQVRNDTLSLHDPSAGDSAWSLGCRVYSRACHALREAATSNEWLKIVREEDKPLRFTFAIGAVPIRFYHGDAGDPPTRYLNISYGELSQRRLAFDLGVPLDGILRVAVETDASGLVSTITLVEMDQANTVTNTYIIQLEEGTTGNILPLRSKGIELPPPTIEPLTTTEEKERWERNAG